MKKIYLYMSILFFILLVIIMFFGRVNRALVVSPAIIHIDKLVVRENDLEILVSPRTSDITYWKYEYYLSDRRLYIKFYEKDSFTNEVPMHSSQVILPIGYNEFDEIYFEGNSNKLIWSKEINNI